MSRLTCAILGSGNIGTDLLHKVQRSSTLDLACLVGIDPDSAGLALARSLGVETSVEGVQWVLDRAEEIDLVFDATSARAHLTHAPQLEEAGVVALDLTPAAVGAHVVPVVNLEQQAAAANINLITCGGQATIPIVAAVAEAADVAYAEIVSTVASKSAGPGTRQNIDEFTETTARGMREVGGAERSKAIIILNPADPPITMTNTVYCGVRGEADETAVAASIERMVQRVQQYVPGYALRTQPIFDQGPFTSYDFAVDTKVTVLLQVEGSADFLPSYAGNLDIMTCAAVAVGERLAEIGLDLASSSPGT